MSKRNQATHWKTAGDAAMAAASVCRGHGEHEAARGWAKIGRQSYRRALWSALRHPLIQRRG